MGVSVTVRMSGCACAQDLPTSTLLLFFQPSLPLLLTHIRLKVYTLISSKNLIPKSLSHPSGSPQHPLLNELHHIELEGSQSSRGHHTDILTETDRISAG